MSELEKFQDIYRSLDLSYQFCLSQLFLPYVNNILYIKIC